MRDFSESPLLVLWEVTQACDLACRHCRAAAQPERNEAELSTSEAYEVLDQIRELGNPLVVFTGGDPLKRPDLFNLIERSVGLGLRTTVTPSATPLLTRAAVARFKDSGVSRMAVSLDGPNKEIHDGFRGVAGSYARTMAALHMAAKIGLETQINTTVARHNVEWLEQIARIVADTHARLWSVFFLVVTGRARLEDDLPGEEYERVFEFLYKLSLIAAFDIKTTEAPHYRRFYAQQRKLSGGGSMAPDGPAASGASPIQRYAGINDGKGLLFISHTGEIYPSGFLELSAGNIRACRLTDAYRNSELFQVIRDSDQLEGKCGVCDYRYLCGGSRSRALALTGNFMASDPRCVYQPTGRPE
ncbi:MAG: TIGR04053 family radical SAM/SPASM domain-containing protein [Acidobacteriota bacterium]